MSDEQFAMKDSGKSLWRIVGPALALSTATLLGYGLLLLPEPYTSNGLQNIGMIYLAAVVFSAARWGFLPSLAAAFGGFLLYHTLFGKAASGLWPIKPHELINLLIFLSATLISALICSRSQHTLEKERLKSALHKERSKKEQGELRSALLASVTHDLKTPLASVIGSLSSIRYVPSLDEQARGKLIVTAHEEAVRLNDFITNILNMTKLEAGPVVADKGWHQPVAIVQRVLKRLRTRTHDHDIVINEPSVPIQFYVDSHLVEQVIQNLLDNAIKYAPKNTPITIDVSEDNHLGIIAFTNHGPGIAEKNRGKIFDKFHRAVKRDSAIAGTGLGLAICDAIMKIHQGSIGVAHAFSDDRMPGVCFKLAFPKIRTIPESMPKTANVTSDA